MGTIGWPAASAEVLMRGRRGYAVGTTGLLLGDYLVGSLVAEELCVMTPQPACSLSGARAAHRPTPLRPEHRPTGVLDKSLMSWST